jgi:riboflavin synthase
MFTGIIASTTKILETEANSDGMILKVSKPSGWKIKLGDSINLNGVCSTVAKLGAGQMMFEYMPESLERSNLGGLKKGDLVNLEQSLRAADRLDGHIVQGHVDVTGKIVSIIKEGNSLVYRIEVKDKKLIRLAAEKGAIAVDGISLTVVAAGKGYFTVKIIPYTVAHTNLRNKKPGDLVNLEFDILAKYLQRLIS